MPRRSRHRLLKRLLRFMPRRAVLHKYPVIGRFAEHLRPRAYLWSFRREHLRRAFYAGAILSLLPLLGIQLPLAAAAAVLLRCNFMVLAALQFITNPLTAGPIYYATHQVGAAAISRFQDTPAPPVADERESAELGTFVAESLGEPLAEQPRPLRWSTRARNAIGAMIVGGVLVGAVLGLLLDGGDALLRKLLPHHERHRHRPHRRTHPHRGTPPSTHHRNVKQPESG